MMPVQKRVHVPGTILAYLQYLCMTCMTLEGFGLHTTMIIVHNLRIKDVGVLTQMGGII